MMFIFSCVFPFSFPPFLPVQSVSKKLGSRLLETFTNSKQKEEEEKIK